MHDLQRLGDNIPHCHARRQGRVRILKDQLGPAAVIRQLCLVEGCQIIGCLAIIIAGGAITDRHSIEQGPAKGCLAGTGFPHQAEERPAFDMQRDVVDRLQFRLAEQPLAKFVGDRKPRGGNQILFSHHRPSPSNRWQATR